MKKIILSIFVITLLLICGTVKESYAQKRADSEKVETLNIVSLLEKGFVDVEIVGAGLEAVKVKIIKKVDNPLKIVIPIGTYFKNRGPAQDMIATATIKVNLPKGKKVTMVNVPAACANFEKDIPYEESKFDVFLSSESEDLRKLMEVIDKKKPSTVVKQVAIWIVTDDVTRGKLDSTFVRTSGLVPFGGGSPAASDEDVINAIRIVEEAGIDVFEKAIVKEKISLIKGLGSGNKEVVSYSARLLGYKGDEKLNLWKIETLIAALKDYDSDVRKAAAAEALNKITGQNYGQNYEAWLKWWEKNKKKFEK